MINSSTIKKIASHFTKRVYIYGAGRQGNFFFNLLKDHVNIDGFIDSVAYKQFGGDIPVYNLTKLQEIDSFQLFVRNGTQVATLTTRGVVN